MPLYSRLETFLQGSMSLIGNTMVLSPSIPTTLFTNLPPWAISAYTSTNSSLVIGPGFPQGTTLDATQSSSSAVLSLEANSEIVYAELFWTSFYFISQPINPNLPVNFTLSNGSTYSIYPDLTRTQSQQNNNAVYTWQSADVTNLIASSGAGTYTVGNIPSYNLTLNQPASRDPTWTLVTVYKNTNMPFRYINVTTGFIFTAINLPGQTFSNFVTPASGPISAYYLLSLTDGDIRDGSQLAIGADQNTAQQVGNTSIGGWNGVTPYAPMDNILPANILVADPSSQNIGLLNTSGSFGTYNVIPFPVGAPTVPPFSRANYSLLGLDISYLISPLQSTLYSQLTYTGITTSTGELTSISVQIDINSARLEASKYVDKITAATGDILNYTVTVQNIGLANANNIVFTDYILPRSQFIPNSLKLNGVTIPSQNLDPPGINLGTFISNQSATLTFQTIVLSLPNNNAITNFSIFDYTFLQSQALPPVLATINTNLVITYISTASLTATKFVNKSQSYISDTIEYKIILNNTGSATLNNVLVIDTLPNGVTIPQNSYYQDNILIPASQYPIAVTLPNSISPGVVSTVTFFAKINSLPDVNPMANIATIKYNYTLDPNSPNSEIGSTSTGYVYTYINVINVAALKYGLSSAYLGTVFTYTIPIYISGNTNTAVYITDNIPYGATFLQNSIALNGVSVPGSLGGTTLVPLGVFSSNILNTVTFRVQITTIPTINPIENFAGILYDFPPGGTSSSIRTNTFTTEILNTSIAISKQAKNFSYIGDIFTYTIPITISGNVSPVVTLIDTIPYGVIFNSNSVRFNGTTLPTEDPKNSIILGTLPAPSTNTLTFSVTVVSIPTINPMPNSARISYTIVGTSQNPTLVYSNTVYTQVNYVNLNNSVKYTSKSIADCGDEITYTIVIPNLGNTDATNVVLIDTIPAGTSFISNSVIINNNSQPNVFPNLGITIPLISAGYVATVTFKVLVTC